MKIIDGIKHGNKVRFPSHRNEDMDIVTNSMAFLKEGAASDMGIITNVSYLGELDEISVMSYLKGGFSTPDGNVVIAILNSYPVITKDKYDVSYSDMKYCCLKCPKEHDTSTGALNCCKTGVYKKF